MKSREEETDYEKMDRLLRHQKYTVYALITLAVALTINTIIQIIEQL